jgi:transcriptional regulator with XRE-family HTH domain
VGGNKMNRLKELRLEKNWTQQQLGEQLNIKNAAISKYETRRAALFDDTIIKLAELFNVSTDYLLGLSNYRNRPNDNSVELNYDASCMKTNDLFNHDADLAINKFCNNVLREEKILKYFNRLNDENKDYILGKMVELFKEQDKFKEYYSNNSASQRDQSLSNTI